MVVLIFFDTQGVIYTNFVPKGETTNISYIHPYCPVQIPQCFQTERPIMSSQEWFLLWDNAPVHTATSVADFLAVTGMKMVPLITGPRPGKLFSLLESEG
jgi:hypothetical protein